MVLQSLELAEVPAARFLIVGAALAAAIQTFVPQSVVDRVSDLPVLSLLAMMVLALASVSAMSVSLLKCVA